MDHMRVLYNYYFICALWLLVIYDAMTIQLILLEGKELWCNKACTSDIIVKYEVILLLLNIIAFVPEIQGVELENEKL